MTEPMYDERDAEVRPFSPHPLVPNTPTDTALQWFRDQGHDPTDIMSGTVFAVDHGDAGWCVRFLVMERQLDGEVAKWPDGAAKRHEDEFHVDTLPEWWGKPWEAGR